MTGPLRIGLTGGIGSGKTTVSNLFRELGVPVIDADVIARELVEPGQPALKSIATLFGNQILTETGELDRQRMRDIIFDDEAKRQQLESVLHPLVYAEIVKRCQRIDFPYCILSIPLLVETGGKEYVDRILVVDAPKSSQIHRAGQRDTIAKENIEKIIASQADRASRLAVADDVISNDRDIDWLKQQVEALHIKYLKYAVLLAESQE